MLLETGNDSLKEPFFLFIAYLSFENSNDICRKDGDDHSDFTVLKFEAAWRFEGITQSQTTRNGVESQNKWHFAHTIAKDLKLNFGDNFENGDGNDD